jgi:hypothetical protein
MIELTIQQDGKEEVFKVPMDPSDITYSDFIDFRKLEEQYFSALQGEEEGEDPEGLITNAVAAVISGPVEILPLSLPGDDIEKVVETPFMLDHLSKLRLYGHIVSIIDQHQPEKVNIDKRYAVEYKGQTYYLEPIEARRHLLAEDKTYEVGEVTQVEESDRLLTAKIDKYGDPDGILEFERELRAMAVLLRKEEEYLPVNVRARTHFIEKHMKLFAGLPMDVVLNVRFFFQRTYRALKQTLITAYFSKASQTSALQGTAKDESGKPKSKAQKTK